MFPYKVTNIVYVVLFYHTKTGEYVLLIKINQKGSKLMTYFAILSKWVKPDSLEFPNFPSNLIASKFQESIPCRYPRREKHKFAVTCRYLVGSNASSSQVATLGA